MIALPRRIPFVLASVLVVLLFGLPAVGESDVAIRSHVVRVEIDGLVATTTVEQTYVNYSDDEQEAVLRFQLPPGAAGHELALWIDGLRCPGAIHPRVAAKRIYREIVEGSRDPALLEYLGGDRWQLSIYPVPAEGTQKVQIRYSQLLRVENGRVVYDGMVPSSDSTVAKAQELDFSVTIRCPGGVRDFHAASDAMGVQRDGERFMAAFRAEQKALGKPVSFAYTPGEAPPAMAAYRPAEGAPIFATMLPAVDVPAAKPRPRNVVMVLDGSASMNEKEYHLAEGAIKRLLASIGPDEKMAVISVGSDVSLWKDRLVPASKANKNAAADWLALRTPEGGTDLTAAFRAVEALNTDKDAPLHVFVFTDGADRICVREAAQPRPTKRLNRPPANCRVYAFCVSWENDQRVEALAAVTGGRVDGGRDEEDLDAAMGRLLAASKGAAVATLGLRIVRGAGQGGIDQAGYSDPAPERRCVVAGRAEGDAPWRVTMKVNAGGGSHAKTLTLPVADQLDRALLWGGPALEKVWAHLRAEQQWRAMQRLDVRLAALQSLVAFSRTHRVVTRATALLALETDLEYLKRGIRRPVSSVKRNQSLSAARKAFDKKIAKTKPSTEDATRLQRAKELIRLGMHPKARDLLASLDLSNPIDVDLVSRAAVMEQYLALRESIHLADAQRKEAQTALEELWAQWRWDELLAPSRPMDPTPRDVREVGDTKPPTAAGDLPVPLGDQGTVRALQKKLPKVNFRKTKFVDAVQWFRDMTGRNIFSRWAVLEAAGIDRNTPIDMKLDDISIDTALGLTLERAGGVVELGFIVDNGVVRISTKEDLQSHTISRIYDVRDVLEYLRVYNPPDRAAESDSWDSGSGSGLFGSGDSGGIFDSGSAAGLFSDSGASPRRTTTGAVRRFVGPNFVGPDSALRRAPTGDDADGAALATGAWTPSAPAGPVDATVIHSLRAFVGRSFSGSGLHLSSGRRYQRREEDVGQLMWLIRSIDPDSWWDNGGTTSHVHEIGGLLVVTATPQVHQQWSTLLSALRERLRRIGGLPAWPARWAAERNPESLYTADSRIAPWVAELLARARAGTLSRFSSVQAAQVGDRPFARIAGVWFDTSLGELCKIRAVARGTAAEVVLRKSNSALAKCFALGEYVVVRVDDRTAVCLDGVGIADAEDAALKKVIRSLSP